MVCTSIAKLFFISKSISARSISSAKSGISNLLELNPAKSESLYDGKSEAAARAVIPTGCGQFGRYELAVFENSGKERRTNGSDVGANVLEFDEQGLPAED